MGGSRHVKCLGGGGIAYSGQNTFSYFFYFLTLLFLTSHSSILLCVLYIDIYFDIFKLEII